MIVRENSCQYKIVAYCSNPYSEKQIRSHPKFPYAGAGKKGL